jgi:hypothetical protein
MKWEKQGLIIQPDPRFEWMQSYAMVPIADFVQGDIYRIYFSGRNKENQSHIGYVEIDIKSPNHLLHISEHPVLSPGELGCFDDNGVTPSWIVSHAGQKYLYYIGWKPRSTTRMSLVAGLSISQDDGSTFMRASRAPIIKLTDGEPFSILTGPCVLKENDLWRMWYVSGVGWAHPDLPRYNIKYAESTDGFHWEQSGTVCIDFASSNENALARPCVLKENDRYKMWYSYKGDAYRIGYAESADGLHWQRQDNDVGIDVSPSGWDSEMIEYAYVFLHKGIRYMLYNGNNYGQGGIGLAVAV